MRNPLAVVGDALLKRFGLPTVESLGLRLVGLEQGLSQLEEAVEMLEQIDGEIRRHAQLKGMSEAELLAAYADADASSERDKVARRRAALHIAGQDGPVEEPARTPTERRAYLQEMLRRIRAANAKLEAAAAGDHRAARRGGLRVAPNHALED